MSFFLSPWISNLLIHVGCKSGTSQILAVHIPQFATSEVLYSVCTPCLSAYSDLALCTIAIAAHLAIII